MRTPWTLLALQMPDTAEPAQPRIYLTLADVGRAVAALF